jgi:tRNA (guanosine-2'-O-)-methyltransferase
METKNTPSKEKLEAVIKKYSYKLTEARRQRLNEIIRLRTRFFTMVLEDLKDAHNISAVIRTSEVFGLQDVHIIEELNPYNSSKAILRGSVKWVNIYRYQNRNTCMHRLKSKGYQIAVASSRAENALSNLDLSRPTAFYLGSESLGNHPDTLKNADIHFRIPQYGLTESMNVSVCAGVLISELNRWMENRGRDRFCLTEQEQLKLRADFYQRSAAGVERNSPVEFVKE